MSPPSSPWQPRSLASWHPASAQTNAKANANAFTNANVSVNANVNANKSTNANANMSTNAKAEAHEATAPLSQTGPHATGCPGVGPGAATARHRR